MGTQTPNKTFGKHLSPPLGQVCPLINILHQTYIYIKHYHINKILKEYFKEKINYNYFIIKGKFFI